MTQYVDTGSEAFQQAFHFTLSHEGGYVNDPSDYGGETIYGISRKYWPKWGGWAIVDAAKNQSNFPRSLNDDKDLAAQVQNFYLVNFWNKFKGDDVAGGSVDVAVEIFDCGVNMGTRRAGKFFQTSLNIFNRNQKSYADITVDGAVGNGSLRAYTSFLRSDSPDMLLKAMLTLRGSYYCKRALEDPSQERFIRGWLNRIVMDKGLEG